MKKSLMKFVFHEQEVADVMFHAMVETGRVVLHMESSSGRESSVDLIGRAVACPVFATPKEDGSAAEGFQDHQAGPFATTLRTSPEPFSGNFTSTTCGC